MKRKILSILFLASALFMVLAITNTVKAEAKTYGKVEAIKEQNEQATVTGSEESNSAVLYEEKEVKWYPADTSLGRNVDGFWIGIKVTAPDGMSEGQLENAKFRRSGEERSFWNLKDSKAEPHYIGLWKRIDKETLQNKTSEITIAEYEFDWNNDGNYEQKISIKIKPDGIKLDDEDVVFVKIGTNHFTFKKGNSLNQLSEAEEKLLKELMTPAGGYKFVGIFDKKTGKEVALDQEISSDMELEIRFEKLPEETAPTTIPEEPADEIEEIADEVEKPTEKDNTPNTGVVDVGLITSVVAMVSAAGIVTVKKYNK